ncbi:hypothetical protein HAZT_HAZT011294 [Hyalella azteca]|uniref:Phytanoyl-CoA dioxygenase family protein n=1 Tax=Hyalella azteca TaxID=294128 RepID=A0A6A0H307_HYAAZ|nr:hypothetical protein HAZT_HAZT011294 [Hyalella azteca]
MNPLHRNLFNESEMNLIRTAIESPDGVQRHAYGRSDGQRTAKLCVWQHPGDDVTGVAVRLEKVAGTMEKVGSRKYWYPNGCLRPDMGTVFMPVDACTEENGCLQVVPGSHQLGRQDHETLGEQLSVERNRLKEILERYPPCPVEMAPGDALFFDCNLLHCSSENNSDKRRYALVSAFNKKLNNPFLEHHHPCYTFLHKLPNSALLECKNVTGLDGKDFLDPKNDTSYISGNSGKVH